MLSDERLGLIDEVFILLVAGDYSVKLSREGVQKGQKIQRCRKRILRLLFFILVGIVSGSSHWEWRRTPVQKRLAHR